MKENVLPVSRADYDITTTIFDINNLEKDVFLSQIAQIFQRQFDLNTSKSFSCPSAISISTLIPESTIAAIKSPCCLSKKTDTT